MPTARPAPPRVAPRRRRARAALTLGLSLGLALAAPLAAQGAAQGAVAGAADEAAADATDEPLPDLTPIMDALEALRGLEFRRPVPAEKQSLEDFAAFVDASLEEELPADRRDGIMRGLVRLGLLAEPIDLAGGFRDALLSQAGAYYDPGSGVFYYLMTGLPAIFMDTIAAHELVHAQQDQHFDLAKLTEAVTGDPDAPRPDDRILAFRFVVEGDATLTMTLQQFAALGQDTGPADVEPVIRMQAEMSMRQLVDSSKTAMAFLGDDNPMAAAMAAMDEIPHYILRPLTAAYLKGAWFCLQVQRDGGWEALDAAYADLPASSEQALHPELYLAETRDEPTPIAFPGFRALADGGWTRLDAAVHGEFYLRVLLGNLGLDDETADLAAAGWDGDLYEAWGSGDDTLIVFASTWDSPVEAYEFQEAYAEGLSAKYPGFAPEDDDLAVADLRYACGEGLGHGALLLRGREVFVIEGAAPDVIDALAGELLELQIEHVR